MLAGVCSERVLFISEADWIPGRGRPVSHRMRIGEYEIVFANISFHRFSASGVQKPHLIFEETARGALSLMSELGVGAVIGDCVDVMILRTVCRAAGLPDFTAAMFSLEVSLKQYRQVGLQLAAVYGGNPAREALGGNTVWLSICKELTPGLTAHGIAGDNILYFPSCTFVQGIMSPDAEKVISRIKSHEVGGKRAGGGILAAGIFNRDFAVFVRACGRLGIEADIITDLTASMAYMGKKEASRFAESLEENGRVRVRDRMPQSDYLAWISAAAAVVVPLRHIGHVAGHLTIANAQRFGVPVIAADVPAARDFIEDGKTGFLYEPRSSESLAERIEFVMNNPAAVAAVTRAGRMSEAEISADTKKSFEKALKKMTGYGM